MSNRIIESIIVKRPLCDVFQLWSNFENFPKFMQHIQSVTRNPDGTSHWVMEGPLGARVEWDAETTALDENKSIAWNSKDSSPVATCGLVTFTYLPSDETEISVLMVYEPPTGMAGDLAANFLGDPEARLRQDVRNFKDYAEG